MRRLLTLALLCLVLSACDATAVSTPSATPTLDITPLPTRTHTVTATPQPTATPQVCPTPVLVWVTLGVYEVNNDGYPIAGVPGVTFAYSPVYHAGEVDRQIAVTSGWVGVTLAQFPPGEWDIVAERWPDGYTSMVLPDGRGYPSSFFASPDDNIVLTYYAYRIASTRTPTAVPPTATPAIHACSNYAVNCVVSCGANQQEDTRGTCGAGLKCCMPMATQTVTP